MPARPFPPASLWPRLMRAETAAAYCDEVSVAAFRRKVGSVTSAGNGQGEPPEMGSPRTGCGGRVPPERSADYYRRRERALARRQVKREANWPRYMKSKRLADGSVAYYWAPHERDRAAGFTLGRSRSAKITRRQLSAQASSINTSTIGAMARTFLKTAPMIDACGTIDWWHHEFFASDPFTSLGAPHPADYREALSAIADLPTVITDAPTGKPMRTERCRSRHYPRPPSTRSTGGCGGMER